MTITTKKTKPRPRAPRTRRRGSESKWKPFLLVELYRLLRVGMSIVDVCRSIEIDRDTFYEWLKKKPELRQVVTLAEKECRGEDESFPDWVYEQLSPQLKELWDKISKWSKTKNGIVKIEAMLQDQGKRVRQQLFLHALCIEKFSPTKAMAKVGLSKKTLDKWINEDLEFAQLVEEIDWHKGNFFEDGLIKLVRSGHPAATVFANRTFNRHRGYAQVSDVNVNVDGKIMHGVIDLASLMPFLSDNAKQEIFQALQKQDERTTLTVAQRTPEEIVGPQIVEAVLAESENSAVGP